MVMSLNYEELIQILKKYLEQKNEGCNLEIKYNNYHYIENVPDGWGFYDEYDRYKLCVYATIYKRIKILNDE